MLKDLIIILTDLHVIIASVCLFVAPVAMVVGKGGRLHRIFGKVFFYGMLVACLTAVITGCWHGKTLLVLIALLSLYLVLSGYRSLYLKKLHRGQKPTVLDKTLQGSALLLNLGLLIWGISMTALNVKNGNGLLYIVFGLIGSGYAFLQYRRFYRNTTDKRQWFFDHMVGFIAGYIGAVTAFSVNVLGSLLPEPFAWMWPSAIGVPLIVFWTGFYRKQFKANRKLRKFVREVKLGLGH